jgi:hypothetical protein
MGTGPFSPDQPPQLSSLADPLFKMCLSSPSLERKKKEEDDCSAHVFWLFKVHPFFFFS